MINLKEIFKNASKNGKPLLLDGAMGSLLQQRGYKIDSRVWTTKLLSTNPEIIIELHKEYIKAGADIITTNTFRTNPAAMMDSELGDYKSYTERAVNYAKIAIEENRNVLIAGSNPPAEDCYQIQRILSLNELQLNHSKHIDLLMFNGVDFILNETQSHFDEIKIICEYSYRNKIPYIMSLYTKDFKHILSGEKLEDMLAYSIDKSAIAVSINCAPLFDVGKLFFNSSIEGNWGFYLNCGSGKPEDNKFESGISHLKYSKFVESYLPYRPSFIGSCCGSNPLHTQNLRKLIDGNSKS